ncbi:MAG: hypothetical protein ACLTDF_08090 [Coprococcus sp.]
MRILVHGGNDPHRWKDENGRPRMLFSMARRMRSVTLYHQCTGDRQYGCKVEP